MRSTSLPASRRGRPGSSPTKRPHTARSKGWAARSRQAGGRDWHVGMVHGSIAIPGKTDRDEVVVTTEEIATSGLDYLALGHWHSAQSGKAGTVTYAYAGAPEAVALDQDRAGKALLVELEEVGAGAPSRSRSARSGRTRFEKLEVDAATVPTQPALIVSLAQAADPDLVLDVRLNGVRPDELDLDTEEMETALAPGFLKVRVRDVSIPGTDQGAASVAGHHPGRIHPGPRGPDPRARGGRVDAAEAAEQRDVLRLGRLLLGGHEVSV